MKKMPHGRLRDLVWLLPILVWLAAYSYPYFFESLSQNYRQIQTYNLDSMVMLRAVEDALSAPWFRLQFIEYGHFYFNMAMATASVLSLFHPVSEWVLFFILRLFSLLGGCCTIAISFIFARRYLGRMEAIFTATVIAFSPRFVEFSNEIKPDSWQVFFMTLSLYFLARACEGSAPTEETLAVRHMRARFGFVLAASAAAGAAFGTKYQGILLIPLLVPVAWMVPADAISERFFARTTRLFLAMAVLLGIGLVWLGRIAYPLNVMLFLQPGSGTGIAPFALYWAIQGSRVACFLAGAACFAAAAAYMFGFDFAPWRRPLAMPIIFCCTALAFLGAFALTSPWLLYHLQFVPNLYQRTDIVGAGAWYGFGWLRMIFGIGPQNPPYFVNHAIGALSILGCALLLVAVGRRKVRAADLPFLFVFGFTVIFITLLIAKINFVTTLYVLPVVPALVLLAAFALHEIRGALPRWPDRRKAAIGAVTLTVAMAAFQVWQGGSQLLQYPLLVTALTPANQKLGDWLARCVPADARVLAAAYSYVPPNIATMAVNWGPDYRYLASNNPDMVTINLEDVALAAEDERKRAANPGYVPSGRSRYYDIILHSGAWQPGPTFAPYRVYVKTSGSVVKPACR